MPFLTSFVFLSFVYVGAKSILAHVITFCRLYELSSCACVIV